MYCKNCGAEVSREYRICPYCDSEIIYPTEQNHKNFIRNIQRRIGIANKK